MKLDDRIMDRRRRERMNETLKSERMGRCFFAVLFLTAVLWLAGAAQVFAAGSGSITLQFDQNASGVAMTLYRVTGYEDGRYPFQGVFADCGISLENLVDAQKTQEIAAQLTAIAQQEGAVGIEKELDGSGVLSFTDLEPGWYLLVQTAGLTEIEIQRVLVPVPFTESDGSLSYDVAVAPKYTIPDGAVILDKVDDEGALVAHAVFRLDKKVYISEDGTLPEDVDTGEDGGGRFYWEPVQTGLELNDQGQLAVAGLIRATYRFVETEAPAGYIRRDTPYYFSITAAGTVVENGGIYKKKTGKVEAVTAVNDQTRVIVNKVDESGAPVAGAKLTVKGSDGNVLRKEDGSASYLFTTTAEPYELKRIPVGSYFLCEVEAPDGYEVSVDEPFTVTGTADESATVTMVDKRETPTSADLTVTKTITDISDFPLMATGTFYVALFSDEACTQRVSGVKELTFDGTVSASVTFSNLEVGTVYYVSETDEAGEPLLSGAVDDKDFIPVYPDGQTVSIEPDRPHTEFAFKNMFYELPYNYYYYGKLTITKQTFRGNDPYNTDEVFYAGVFEDSDYTQRLGDVIELAMYGGSETSVTINVAIGNDSNSSRTYYVAETDEDGNVLKNSPDLEFEVSVDKTEVTLRPKTDGTVPEETVTIRNVFEEEETETETETETPSQTETTPATETETTPQTTPPGTPSTNPPGGNVRTGDDTPVAQIAVVFAVAGVAVILLIATGVKKRKKK